MEQINKTHSVTKLTGRQSACFLVKYGLKNAVRPINCDLYAYAANNPLRYIDPDGKRLELFFNKSTQTLSVRFRQTKNSTPWWYTLTSDQVTSNVVPGDRRTIQTRDDGTLQKNGTKPTQFPNGEYNLTGIGNTSDKSKYGEIWIKTDAAQDLPVFTGEQVAPGKFENLTPVFDDNDIQVYVTDSGYYIHYTIYSNTYGCLGLKSEDDMKQLILLFIWNKNTDDPTAKIYVRGNPEEYGK